MMLFKRKSSALDHEEIHRYVSDLSDLNSLRNHTHNVKEREQYDREIAVVHRILLYLMEDEQQYGSN